MEELEKRNSQNELITMVLEGIANSIIETLSKNKANEESQDNLNDRNIR